MLRRASVKRILAILSREKDEVAVSFPLSLHSHLAYSA